MKTITKLIAILAFSFSAIAFAKPTIELYKSPACGCCVEWADIMEEKGYKVNVHHQRDWSAVQQKFGMPSNLQSCHTAVIDGYMVEGHVPEEDIARLLSERPSDITGLSAPGMPQHSPGMAAPGKEYKDFNVIAFDKNGNLSLYKKY
jgi:hypothetical protein